MAGARPSVGAILGNWEGSRTEKAIMSSPSKDPGTPRPELDYAPPWARDQNRPALGDPVPVPLENELGQELARITRADELTWQQRALEPEMVPEPTDGAPTLWPTMLRMGVVCAIAAFVAAAVVLLFNPKQGAHKATEAATAPPAAGSDEKSTLLAGAARIVPALAEQRTTALATTAPQHLPPRDYQAATAATQPTAAPLPTSSAVKTPLASPAAAAPVATSPAATSPAATSPAAGSPSVPPTVTPQLAVNTAPSPAQAAESAPATSNAPAKTQVASIPEQQPDNSIAVKQALQNSPKPSVVLDDNEIETLIRRGNNLLKVGDFSAARVLFERAANAGSADGALALGSTYDPVVIKRLGAFSVKPDIESARKWYQFAADRGSAAAKLQLANLPAGR
jgi:hypothetical protein